MRTPVLHSFLHALFRSAFVLLPTITQSIAFRFCGSAVLFTFLGWLDQTLPPFDHFYENLLVLMIGLAAGGLCLALSEWLRAKGRKDLVGVSHIFGALAILVFDFILAMLGILMGANAISHPETGESHANWFFEA